MLPGVGLQLRNFRIGLHDEAVTGQPEPEKTAGGVEGRAGRLEFVPALVEVVLREAVETLEAGRFEVGQRFDDEIARVAFIAQSLQREKAVTAFPVPEAPDAGGVLHAGLRVRDEQMRDIRIDEQQILLFEKDRSQVREPDIAVAL